MTKKIVAYDKLCKEILELVNQCGQDGLNPVFISQNLGLPLHKLHEIFPEKVDIVLALQDYWQNNFLQELEKNKDNLGLDDTIGDSMEGGFAPKEILAELILIRLEQHQAYKKACRVIWKNQMSMSFIPGAAIGLKFLDAMTWLVEMAGLETTGPYGVFRQKALASVYGITLMTWFEDMSYDMAKTTATLNDLLDKTERYFPQVWKV